MEARFRYPLDPQPRMVTFAEAGPWRPGDAETAAIAARLLPRVWSDVWTPTLAIVVLTGPLFGALDEDGRELIWRRWGVPIYEFLTDGAGAVLASECDAHEGLHVHSEKPAAAVRECGCGITGPMLSSGAIAEAVGGDRRLY